MIRHFAEITCTSCVRLVIPNGFRTLRLKGGDQEVRLPNSETPFLDSLARVILFKNIRRLSSPLPVIVQLTFPLTLPLLHTRRAP